jgi:glycosyltransferase involved in cell wall biosynthesis
MAKKMKIALVTSAFGDTGGPEVATLNLANALVKKGVDVTLFAPADFKTIAKHIPTLNKSIWKMKDFKYQTRFVRRNYIVASQTKVLGYNEFDLIHLNTQKYAYGIGASAKAPCLLTYHSLITKPELSQVKSAGMFTVALSNSHKKGMKVSAVIPNGIDTSSIKPCFKPKEYLIAIGRLEEKKGIHNAIKIAKASGRKLLIVGRVGIAPARLNYFEKKIKPHLSEDIVHMDEVPQKVLFKYIREASALLIPIKPRAEALNVMPLLTMEALACGTPVIGVPVSSAPKSMANSGVAVLSNDIKVLIKAAKNLEQFDRVKCREYAVNHFDSSIMADEYIKLYKRILKK